MYGCVGVCVYACVGGMDCYGCVVQGRRELHAHQAQLELESLLDTARAHSLEQAAQEGVTAAHQREVQAYAASQWTTPAPAPGPGMEVGGAARRVGVVIPRTGVLRKQHPAVGPSAVPGDGRTPVKVSPPASKTSKFTGRIRGAAPRQPIAGSWQQPVIHKKSRLHTSSALMSTPTAGAGAARIAAATGRKYVWELVDPPAPGTWTGDSQGRYRAGEEENLSEQLVVNSRNLMKQIRQRLNTPVITSPGSLSAAASPESPPTNFSQL